MMHKTRKYCFPFEIIVFFFQFPFDISFLVLRINSINLTQFILLSLVYQYGYEKESCFPFDLSFFFFLPPFTDFQSLNHVASQVDVCTGKQDNLMAWRFRDYSKHSLVHIVVCHDFTQHYYVPGS